MNVRKTYCCSLCGEPGHNARTCGQDRTAPSPRNPVSAKEAYEANHPGITDLLGQVPDSAVASKYGISRQRVQQIRVRLGVPSYSEQEGIGRPLTDDEVSLLGTMPDNELGMVLNTGRHRVSCERKKRGIPPFSPMDVLDDLLEPVKDQLGKVSDRKLARKLGLRTGQVQRYRNARGIPTEILSPRCEGFEPLDRGEITRLFHEGKSDVEIAEALDSTRASIARIRTQELGLLRKRSPRNRRDPRKTTPEQRDEILRLYEDTDNMAEVARRTGWSYDHVRRIVHEVSEARSGG